MNWHWLDVALNFTAFAALVFAVLHLNHQATKARIDLDNVRWAAYDLIASQQRDIQDLRQSLQDAGITVSRKHQMDYVTQMAKPAEQRHAESVAAFEEAAARVKRADEDT